MSTNSKIEWTEDTWNPVAGCSMVSEGCRHCYAVAMTHRLGAIAEAAEAKGKDPGKTAHYKGLTVLNGRDERHFNGTVRTIESALDIPLRRKKPTLYFVNSMADLFHKDVPFEFIDKVFAVMALCPQHTFQVLTKRPERMAGYMCQKFMPFADSHGREESLVNIAEANGISVELKTPPGHLSEPWGNAAGIPWPLPNVWLGTSVEDQETADERIPHLLKCPAAVRWLSMEPLLGPVDLPDKHAGTICGYGGRACREKYEHGTSVCGECPLRQSKMFDWVVLGGESGKGARPMHPDWARDIRDQCEAAGVAFHFKQWGDWMPWGDDSAW